MFFFFFRFTGRQPTLLTFSFRWFHTQQHIPELSPLLVRLVSRITLKPFAPFSAFSRPKCRNRFEPLATEATERRRKLPLLLLTPLPSHYLLPCFQRETQNSRPGQKKDFTLTEVVDGQKKRVKNFEKWTPAESRLARLPLLAWLACFFCFTMRTPLEFAHATKKCLLRFKQTCPLACFHLAEQQAETQGESERAREIG